MLQLVMCCLIVLCACVCVSVCACVKVPELQIYTNSQAILCFIKWESSVKLSGFNGGTVVCVCVCVHVRARVCACVCEHALSTFSPHLQFLC